MSTSIIIILIAIFVGLLGLSFYAYSKYVKPISNDGSEVDRSLMNSLKAKADRFYKKIGPVTAKLKIIISTFQILSVSLQSFQITMPVSYTGFISGLDIMMIDIVNVMPIGCIKRLNYVDTLIIKTLFPPLFVGLLFVCFMAELSIRNRKLLQEHTNNHLQLKTHLIILIRDLKFKYISLTLLFSYLYLPGVTVAIFQAFICQNLDPGSSDGDYYLVADYSINCASPYMKFARVWASFMILLYPIGITLLYFWLLYKKRNEIVHRNDSDGRDTISGQKTSVITLKCLYESYKPKFWYFEIVETSRRLMLTGVLSITNAGNSGQVIFGIILAVFYTKVYAYYQPYDMEESSIIAELAQYQIFFSFFGSLVVQNSLLAPSYNNLIGGLMIVLNLSAALLSVYYEYTRSLKENAIEPDNDNNTSRNTNTMFNDYNSDRNSTIEMMSDTPNPLLHRIDVKQAPTIVEKFVDKYISTFTVNDDTNTDNTNTDTDTTRESYRID